MKYQKLNDDINKQVKEKENEVKKLETQVRVQREAQKHKAEEDEEIKKLSKSLASEKNKLESQSQTLNQT